MTVRLESGAVPLQCDLVGPVNVYEIREVNLIWLNRDRGGQCYRGRGYCLRRAVVRHRRQDFHSVQARSAEIVAKMTEAPIRPWSK